MKAYKAEDIYGDGYSTVVFAETRGKAHSAAMDTDCCQDSEWNHVRVNRVPSLDAEYRGYTEMDWYDRKDRLALVKAGWHCEEVDDPEDCGMCSGRDFCTTYAEYMEDVEKGVYDP